MGEHQQTWTSQKKHLEQYLTELTLLVAKDSACDQDALDFAGTLVDIGNTRVAEPLLGQIVFRKALRSEQLETALRDLP